MLAGVSTASDGIRAETPRCYTVAYNKQKKHCTSHNRVVFCRINNNMPKQKRTKNVPEETESDVNETLPPPSPPQPQEENNKKPRNSRAPLFLTEEQEEDLADWVKSHECLYMKGKREYKDTALKKNLWEKKAEELGVSTKSLTTWYDSIRTKVGKLTNQPSGSSAKSLTDRDRFILRNFDFLKSHIARMTSRLAVSVSHFTCLMF